MGLVMTTAFMTLVHLRVLFCHIASQTVQYRIVGWLINTEGKHLQLRGSAQIEILSRLLPGGTEETYKSISKLLVVLIQI
jgi:hypothetical protein